MKSIYINRISDINKQIAKLIDGERIGIKAYDVIIRLDYKDVILKKECILIANKYIKHIDHHGGTNLELMQYVVPCVVLDKYNYEYNPFDIVEMYDLEKDKFYRLYLKVKEWCINHYWC